MQAGIYTTSQYDNDSLTNYILAALQFFCMKRLWMSQKKVWDLKFILLVTAIVRYWEEIKLVCSAEFYLPLVVRQKLQTLLLP